MWIGIDLGTSACKVVAVDGTGVVVRHSTRDYPLDVPHAGWAEQDPGDWWRATDEAVRDVVAQVDAVSVRGIGLCGQMHGLTALDADGKIVLPAILWNDQRCAAECDSIVAAAGGLDALLQMTNNRMLPGYTAGKLLWVRQHRPQAYARIRSVLNPKDYLRFRMTGRLCTDVSDASGTGLFDVRRRAWSTELLDRVDVDHDLLPDVAESSEITGTLDDQIARSWGLPLGTPVVGGGGDSVLQTTSMGIVDPGCQGITIGTAGIVGAADSGCPDNPGGRLQISCGNAPDRWHTMGVSLNAGGDYAWLRSVLSGVLPDGQSLDFADLNRLAEQAPAGSEGLIFLPYLSGERAPHVAPDASAAWIGLTGRHSAAHLVRSLLEGVLLNIRQVTELVAASAGPPERILVSGGASAEPIWLQLLADVTGQPVSPVSGAEHGGAFGAALLAGVGTGGWPDLDTALEFVTADRPTEPDPAAHAIYDRIYPVFAGLYPALKQTFAELRADPGHRVNGSDGSAGAQPNRQRSEGVLR